MRAAYSKNYETATLPGLFERTAQRLLPQTNYSPNFSLSLVTDDGTQHELEGYFKVKYQLAQPLQPKSFTQMLVHRKPGPHNSI